MGHTHLPFDIVSLAESELSHQHVTLCTLLWESEGKEGRREGRGEGRGWGGAREAGREKKGKGGRRSKEERKEGEREGWKVILNLLMAG